MIVNDITCKHYIGKTKTEDLHNYLRHKFIYSNRDRAQRSHLFASIRKYGREHFHIYPLLEGTSNNEICEHEKLLIKTLKAQHPDIGYNICRGGEGFTGPHTEETKKKIGAKSGWWKGKKRPPISKEHADKLHAGDETPSSQKSLATRMSLRMMGNTNSVGVVRTPKQRAAASLRAKEQGFGGASFWKTPVGLHKRALCKRGHPNIPAVL
jgi:hypothetical protein